MSSSAYPVIWAMKHAPVADRIEKLILWELADSGDPDGCDCYASIATIARGAMCDDETVRQRLRSLQERGVIRPQIEPPNKPGWGRIPSGRRPVVYEVMIPHSWWSDAQQLDEVNQLREHRGSNMAPITPQMRPDLPDTEPARKARSDKGKRLCTWDEGHPQRKPISLSTRLAVYTRDGRTCRNCGTGRDLTIDHIHPIAYGGTNDIANLQTLCGPCNTNKGSQVATQNTPPWKVT